MVKTTLTHDRSQAGFTLVELAIVMIIIGLLIGGILKGQELIQNAQVTATSSQVKAIEAALNTFTDSYNAMPGDMLAPGTRLPNCTAAPCNVAGNGNGRIAEAPADAAAAGSEATRFWAQMASVDLLGGIDPSSADIAWGDALPSADIGGGFTIGYAAAAGNLTGSGGAFSSGHYLSMRQTPGTAIAASPANANLQPTQAARIDRKLDDGASDAGSVRAAGDGNCYAAAAYQEQNASTECQLYVRIKQ